MADHTEDHLESRMLHRLVFFSDAVFAIVITLLAIELHAPETPADQVWNSWRLIAGQLVAFAVSFGLIAIFWAAHMAILRKLVAFDWAVAWINILFLFFITLTPLVSSFLGQHGMLSDAWQIYCTLLIAITLAQCALVLATSRDHGRLVGGITAREFWYRFLRAASPGVAFGGGLALSLSGQREAAAICFAIIPVLLALIRLTLGGRRPRPQA